MMTAQEIFNRVAVHLATQRVQSANNGICTYRGQGGAMCAVGCLIPEHHYRPEFDRLRQLDELFLKQPELFPGGASPTSTSVYDMLRYSRFAEALAAGGVDVNEHVDLLADLQKAHDSMPYEYAPKTVVMLKQIAKKYGLLAGAVVDLPEEECEGTLCPANF